LTRRFGHFFVENLAKTDCGFANAELSVLPQNEAKRLRNRVRRRSKFAEFERFALVLDCHAGNLVALEVSAGGLCAVLIEPRKARAVKLLAGFQDPLRERIGLGQ